MADLLAEFNKLKRKHAEDIVMATAEGVNAQVLKQKHQDRERRVAQLNQPIAFRRLPARQGSRESLMVHRPGIEPGIAKIIAHAYTCQFYEKDHPVFGKHGGAEKCLEKLTKKW